MLGESLLEFSTLWPYNGCAQFSKWVGLVAEVYYRSGLSIEAAAHIMGCTVAELQGLVRLSYLEPERLQRLDRSPPPPTTWFLLAEAATEEEFEAALQALDNLKPGQSSFQAVWTALKENAAPDIQERVASLSSACFWHLAHKAKVYNVLTPKARRFLADIAKKKQKADRESQPLTLSRKQLAWLINVLYELVVEGIVSENSPDGDQEQCDAVLVALGKKRGDESGQKL